MYFYNRGNETDLSITMSGGRKIRNHEGRAETEFDRDSNEERWSETRTVIDKQS